MAYGLDFEEIYYTDHERYDLGVLQTYDINIDLAAEKDFQIISPEPVIPVRGFWYIQDTEYGGIVDAFETDSDEEKIEYTGRTFRGLLHSHIVDVEGEERTIPSNIEVPLDDGGITDDSHLIVATITDCFRELIEECGLENTFVVDEPDIGESINPLTPNYTFKRGSTLYDVLVGLANSIDFSFVLEYKSDHYIHIIPILIQDYTDYLKGSKYDALGFKTEIDSAVVNHIVCAIENEGEPVRNIHVFTDENGGIQPFATVSNPIKDSQYILDKRNQVLFGIDEITEYQESIGSVIETYEPLAEVPDDWLTNFGSYYLHQFDETDQSESWDAYEAVGEEVYIPVTTIPSDWRNNFSSYFKRSWNEETGEYTYSSYSAESQLDPSTRVAITRKPSDWETNYNEYYYAFQTGSGIEYRPFDGVSADNYVRIWTQPSDWTSNFSSYYRKVYAKTTGKGKKKKTTLVDTVNHKGAYYVNCKADDDKKGGTVPSFTKRAHYRKDSYTTVPTFLSNNCYRLKSMNVPPTYLAQNCYSMVMAYHAPVFVEGESYAKVLDHYASAIESAKETFYNEKKKSMQTMSLEDFEVNIGDIVGGTDEFTGTNVIGGITNIEARIESGLIDVSYSVTVDDYTTKINIGRLPDTTEEE